MVHEKSKYVLESFLNLNQTLSITENIEKADDVSLAPSNGQNNLDNTGSISFNKARDGTLVRLAESYLEVTFTYNTQSPAGTAADGADITFENDVVSKMFDSAELSIGGIPVERINYVNVVNELVGLVSYSSDEDKMAGASMGWIPDYGAGSSELTLSGLVAALNVAIPGIKIDGNAVTSTTGAITNANINAAINALNLTGTIPGASGISAINNSGYFKRKIFYNKPQSALSNAVAGTSRTCTLCVPLGHFFTSFTTYDKILYNINIELRLTRFGGTASTGNISTTSGTSVGRLVYSQVPNTTMGFQTNSITWVIPQYRLTQSGKAKFYKQVENPQNMICLIRETPSILTTAAGSFTHDLGSRANVPRYVIVGFKNNTVGGVNQENQVTVNRGLFTHGYVNDIYITLGSERYPYQPMNCDFPNNKYAVPFQLFRKFCKNMGWSPSIDYTDFRDRFPIFCFDLSARAAVLDTNTTSINVQLNVKRSGFNAADFIEVYTVLFCTRNYTLDYVSGNCSTQDRT